MLKKTASSLNAQKLRLILLGTIALMIIVFVAIFIFTRGLLVQYVADVERVTSTAESSSRNLTVLSTLKTKLAEERDAVERTKSLVAESQSYAYQDQIIKDLNTFAEKSKIGITGYQFSDGTPAAGTAAPATAATPGATATPPVAGLKTVSVSISLKSPADYKDIMDFVHMIEQNLTKMQLGGISINRDQTSDKVAVSSLTLEVYVR